MGFLPLGKICGGFEKLFALRGNAKKRHHKITFVENDNFSLK
jgi:hypothetical protein